MIWKRIRVIGEKKSDLNHIILRKKKVKNSNVLGGMVKEYILGTYLITLKRLYREVTVYISHTYQVES